MGGVQLAVSWFFLLACLFSASAWAKNSRGPRIVSSQTSPSFRAIPSVREVPADHVFYDNYAKDFSWFDVNDHRALFHLDKVKEAAPVPETQVFRRLWSAEAVAPDNCLGCAPGGGTGLPEADVSWLTDDFFESQMLKEPQDLVNNCLFYSALYQPDDLTLFLTKYNAFPPGVDPALSELATQTACQRGWWTLWMLFPGYAPQGEFPGGTTELQQFNFWEMYVKGSWLEPLKNKGQTRTYFENMSRSMANVCSGDIRVLSMKPTKLDTYKGRILDGTELPKLRERIKNSGPNGSPFRLISIDAMDLNKQYWLNWDTLAVMAQLKKRDPLWIDFYGKETTAAKRDTCDQNVAFESGAGYGNGDWFG